MTFGPGGDVEKGLSEEHKAAASAGKAKLEAAGGPKTIGTGWTTIVSAIVVGVFWFAAAQFGLNLDRLVDLFGVVSAGQGRIGCVIGEPGIGKSRLLAELRADVERLDPAAEWIEGRCLSYGTTVPYHLVLEVVRSLIGGETPFPRESSESAATEAAA